MVRNLLQFVELFTISVLLHFLFYWPIYSSCKWSKCTSRGQTYCHFLAKKVQQLCSFLKVVHRVLTETIPGNWCNSDLMKQWFPTKKVITVLNTKTLLYQNLYLDGNQYKPALNMFYFCNHSYYQYEDHWKQDYTKVECFQLDVSCHWNISS